jgi:peptidoglycan/LPS O-acetylase OafA/YrhL
VIWKASLKRVTENRKYLPQIDGLRFLAIMAVIFVHTGGISAFNTEREYANGMEQQNFMRLVWLGRYGVELFFMISGFILAFPFVKAAAGERSQVNLRGYYMRRLTRIEPPYLVSMLGFFIASITIGKYTTEALLPHLYASLAYVHNIIYGTGSIINNVAWSLEVEIQFYLLFPLLAVVLRWRPSLRYTAISAMALPSATYHNWARPDWPETVLKYGHYFAVGILLCDIYIRAHFQDRKALRWDLLSILGCAIFFIGNLLLKKQPLDIYNPLAFSMLFWAALCGSVTQALLSFGIIPIVGGMCYSIYLLHARVLSVGIHSINSLPLTGFQFIDVVLMFSVLAPLCVIASIPFYLLIERPCMNHDWPAQVVRHMRALACSIRERLA